MCDVNLVHMHVRCEVSGRSCRFKGNTHCEAELIKMALKSSTREICSCVSPDAFKDLSSNQRQGVRISLVRTPNYLSILMFVFMYFANPKQVT